MKSQYILEAQDAYKVYYLDQIEVPAVNGVDFKLKRGEFVTVMGPSGSGKTTFLDILTAMSRPTKGKVLINGKNISHMDDSELAKTRGKTIGFVFQVFNLIPRLTALENVMLPLWFAGYSKEERKERGMQVLKDVGLEDRMNHKPSQLSGGQRQRVAIARALANNPEVLVADEPTGNLDSKSGQQVLDLIKKLHDKGKTILMVTHENYVAKMAEKTIYIHDGKILERKNNHKEKIPAR